MKLFISKPEIASYWFGYLRSRAYMFESRYRIRCRAPSSDVGHLYQFAKDLGTFKMPRLIQSARGGYSQLIIDNKQFCELLLALGWNDTFSRELEWRHVARGIIDGRGSISRNGRGRQSKYLRVELYLRDRAIIEWFNNKRVWVGANAVQLCKTLYLNQYRYLGRKFEKLKGFIIPQ